MRTPADSAGQPGKTLAVIQIKHLVTGIKIAYSKSFATVKVAKVFLTLAIKIDPIQVVPQQRCHHRQVTLLRQ
jgi:hypothetical protein